MSGLWPRKALPLLGAYGSRVSAMRARLRSSSGSLAWLVVSQHLSRTASRCVDSFNWGRRHLAGATDVDHWRGNGALGSSGSISFLSDLTHVVVRDRSRNASP